MFLKDEQQLLWSWNQNQGSLGNELACPIRYGPQFICRITYATSICKSQTSQRLNQFFVHRIWGPTTWGYFVFFFQGFHSKIRATNLEKNPSKLWQISWTSRGIHRLDPSDTDAGDHSSSSRCPQSQLDHAQDVRDQGGMYVLRFCR